MIGRVVGNSVGEIVFRASPGTRFSVGELVIVHDDECEERYLCRVIDIRHGIEASGDAWAEKTAGTMLSLDSSGESYEVHERDRRLFKLGICSPLGIVSDGRLRKVRTLPAHFSSVTRCEAGDFGFLAEGEKGIEIGVLRSGERLLEMPVSLARGAIPHHIGIFATTGMGKSNLMKCLAASAMVNGGLGMLILDPHGEYLDGGSGVRRKGLVHLRLSGERLMIFTNRSIDRPHNHIRISASEIKVRDLVDIFDVTEAQKELLWAAQARYGGSWLLELFSRETGDILSDLRNQFQDVTINVIKRRARSILDSAVVSRDETISVTRQIIDAVRSEKVILVDTSDLTDIEEMIVNSVFARALFDSYRGIYSRRETERAPPVLITLEEAQRLLDGSKSGIFPRIAREGRKFKVGLCAISQQPRLLDQQILSQFNTLLVLGLADNKDREKLKDSAKQDISALDREIQTLMAGEAIISSPFVPFALPSKIHLFEEYVERLNDGDLRQRDEGKRLDSGFF